MTYNYNRLWKLLIDKGVRKTQMRLQAGISRRKSVQIYLLKCESANLLQWKALQRLQSP